MSRPQQSERKGKERSVASRRQNPKRVNGAADLARWDAAWPGDPDEAPELDDAAWFDPADLLDVDPAMPAEDVEAAWQAALATCRQSQSAERLVQRDLFGHLGRRD
jgi:8-oxo-dGTP pyrophosphatase MutT (NUDIX family)